MLPQKYLSDKVSSHFNIAHQVLKKAPKWGNGKTAIVEVVLEKPNTIYCADPVTRWLHRA